MKNLFSFRNSSIIIILLSIQHGGCGGGCNGTSDGSGCNLWSPGDTDPEEWNPHQAVPTDPCTFEHWEEFIYNFQCSNAGMDPNWVKNAGNGYYYPAVINACAHVDPTDSPSTWEAAARAKCSSVCRSLTHTLNDYKCDDEDWSLVEPVGVDCKFQGCMAETLSLDVDLIESVAGSDVAEALEDLPCHLALNCIDYLSVDARTALVTDGYVNPRSTAETLVETFSESSIVNVAGFGYGVSSPGPSAELTGQAAYTAVDCGERACPFYLAQLDLETAAPVTFPFVYDTTNMEKTLSGGSLSLVRPAMGVWFNQYGVVIFPANSLRIQGGGTLSGTPELDDENGYYGTEDLLLSDYIFGSVDPVTGDFSLSMEGDISGVSWDTLVAFEAE